MANYSQELAQDAVCQSYTGNMTGLWFLPARPLKLNTNEWMNEYFVWCMPPVFYERSRICCYFLKMGCEFIVE